MPREGGCSSPTVRVLDVLGIGAFEAVGKFAQERCQSLTRSGRHLGDLSVAFIRDCEGAIRADGHAAHLKIIDGVDELPEVLVLVGHGAPAGRPRSRAYHWRLARRHGGDTSVAARFFCVALFSRADHRLTFRPEQ
jgi:hypothetical protein